MAFYRVSNGGSAVGNINLGYVSSFNISQFYPNAYDSWTDDTFLVELDVTNSVDTGSGYSETAVWGDGFNIGKSYNSNTGVITITNYSQTIALRRSGSTKRSISQPIKYKLWLITGNKTNLGQVSSYNASSLPNYQQLTVDDFIVEVKSAPQVSSRQAGYDVGMECKASGFPISKTYNPSTGIFTVSGLTQTLGQGGAYTTTQSVVWNVWLLK